MSGRSWPRSLIVAVASLGAIVVVVVSHSGHLAADDAGAARRNARRQLEEAARLARDYARSRDSLPARQKVVDQAIVAGRPAALAVLGMVERELNTLLARYRRDFYGGIDASPTIDVATVLATHESLGRDRERLAAWEEMAVRLRPIRGTVTNTAASDGDTVEDFDTFLGRLEQRTLDAWLSDKGLRRLADSETALIAATNRYRAREGLPALEVDDLLCVAARDHSLDMTRENFFSHSSDAEGKRSHVQRAKRFGTTAVSENIASCLSPAQAFSLWQASPPHDRNMLNPAFRRIGVGHVGKKYTMMFGL